MAHPAPDPSVVSVWPSRHSQCPGVWDSRVVRVFEPGSCRVRSARSYGIRDLIWAMRGSMLPAPLGAVGAVAAAGAPAAGAGTPAFTSAASSSSAASVRFFRSLSENVTISLRPITRAPQIRLDTSTGDGRGERGEGAV